MSKWTLGDHINAHLTQPRLGIARQPSLWPSDASAVLINEHNETYVEGSCRRHTFLRFTRDQFIYDNQVNDQYRPLVEELYALESDPDRYLRWIWIAGNLFEEFVISQAKESGVYKASQIQVVIPGWNVVGKLDLLVENPVTGGLIAEEVKSIYGYYPEKAVLGTNSDRAHKKLGKPKTNNMMQAALYDWVLKNHIPKFEATRLFYGDRGTGKDAEFEITTYLDPDDGLTHIKYKGVFPFETPAVKSDITIDNILTQYKYVSDHYTNGTLPPRDFDLEVSPEKIHLLYERGDLTDSQTESYEKILERQRVNAELIAEGKKPKKELKPLSITNFMCARCDFRNFCYSSTDNTPRHG